ncbi:MULTISPECIES: DUF1481 domain-containing protein [Pantoea]|jgi:hypothetical protein|uniref:DUF1481 domain-containing protein n=1 Tax=Pantoea brenneri TaxID=472694 RepID=A0A7Y6NIJ1_9GAMM|nr:MULTISPECIES: DUF1481 domain-containing protein [Pantoea]MBZ6397597.1 DUF1481 domain-containing protein [Pantoea sp.]MBZ6440766.1 DUF1481 domain-containing protein [Pantoea sp.]MDU7866060.1 DUF1481 domain-containing protein [Pantoea sp.]NUY44213.1 DUF1481 domain-containing protein [Pantoea brenneri]NUY51713.1 DUF1481 domain-containing protein [Pantoea brenneri]
MTTLLQRFSALSLSLLLFGCSSTPDIPPFSASGYLADRGVVRIWRKNNDHQSVHIRTIFTPFASGEGEITDYIWLEEALISVHRQVKGEHPDDVTLRFDQEGGLNFMQRQLAGRREAVSPDAVELYKFDAQRMRHVSDALLSGRIFLRQGHWQGGNLIESCEGQQVRPAFDSDALRTLAQQQRGSASPLMVSWLEAPEGVQLLRLSQQDDCAQQPKEEDM